MPKWLARLKSAESPTTTPVRELAPLELLSFAKLAPARTPHWALGACAEAVETPAVNRSAEAIMIERRFIVPLSSVNAVTGRDGRSGCVGSACTTSRTGDARATLPLIHISEPTSRTPISYAVFCLKKKK